MQMSVLLGKELTSAIIAKRPGEGKGVLALFSCSVVSCSTMIVLIILAFMLLDVWYFF
jgi:hypothetical protein